MGSMDLDKVDFHISFNEANAGLWGRMFKKLEITFRNEPSRFNIKCYSQEMETWYYIAEVKDFNKKDYKLEMPSV